MDFLKLKSNLIQNHEALRLMEKAALTCKIPMQDLVNLRNKMEDLKKETNEHLLFVCSNFRDFVAFFRDYWFLEMELNYSVKQLRLGKNVGEVNEFTDDDFGADDFEYLKMLLNDLKMAWSRISKELELIESSCDNDGSLPELRMRLEEWKNCKESLKDDIDRLHNSDIVSDKKGRRRLRTQNKDLNNRYKELSSRIPEVEVEVEVDGTEILIQHYITSGSIPSLMGKLKDDVDKLKDNLEEMEFDEQLVDNISDCRHLRSKLEPWIKKWNKLMKILKLLNKDGNETMLKFWKEINLLDCKFVFLASKLMETDNIGKKQELNFFSKAKSFLSTVIEEAADLDSGGRQSLLEWLKESPGGTVEWKALQETRALAVHTGRELSDLLVCFLEHSRTSIDQYLPLKVKFQHLNFVVAEKLANAFDTATFEGSKSWGQKFYFEEAEISEILHGFIKAAGHLDIVLSCPSLHGTDKSMIAEANLKMKDSLEKCLCEMQRLKLKLHVQYDHHEVIDILWNDMMK